MILVAGSPGCAKLIQVAHAACATYPLPVARDAESARMT